VALTFRDVIHRPNAVARVGSELWVTSASQPLERLDAMTGARLGGVAAVPAGGKAISVRGDRVWVANTRQQLAVCLSAATHQVIARAPLSGRAIDIAADASGGAWVAVHGPRKDGPDTVVHYDGSGRAVRTVTIKPGVSSIALGGGALWVAAMRTAKIVRVDVASGARMNWARLVLAAYGLAYGGGYLWAGSPNDDVVYRIDPRVRDTAPSHSAGRRPEQLAYADGRLFVASSNNQSLLVLDPRTLKPAHAPLQMPLDPFAVTADARHVWVTGIGENTVTRVDLS
jgi:outer membrane protein assembly factor BamB